MAIVIGSIESTSFQRQKIRRCVAETEDSPTPTQAHKENKC